VPPLEQLFTLCQSIDNWLNKNQQNIAVIHCGVGLGRTVTCISAYLSYSQYENMTPAKALDHVCKQMNGTPKTLTLPSQTRWLAYLTKILVNKQYPNSNSFILQNITMHGIPVFDEHIIQISNENKNENKNENEIENGKGAENGNKTANKTEDIELQQRVQKIREWVDAHGTDELENSQGAQNSILCISCAEKQRETVFRGCGHMCLCEGCSRNMKECPICHQRGKAIKVFLA